jgi:cephalosporin hydroxylase
LPIAWLAFSKEEILMGAFPNFDSTAGTAQAFKMNDGESRRRITKYDNYFAIYDSCMAHLVGTDASLIEIGVQHGGSLDMWRNYLGPTARIIGVDINEDCRQFADDRTQIFIGDQSDAAFLTELSHQIGQADVIIDDGSHVPSHQRATFERLFYDNLKDGGFYVVEDCHTSYWRRYGGGYHSKGSFIEYSKALVDELNHWHARDDKVPQSRATHWVASITFYSSVVVFQKRAMTRPEAVWTGGRTLDLDAPFKDVHGSSVILALKKSDIVQAAVRRNPMLWRAMRRIMAMRRS